MKCSNCGYVYNGVGNPSNCPKCGYSFGNSNDEDKGLSTKSKIATGVGAAAGLAAGIGMLAYQNRDVVVDASENISDTNNNTDDSNLNVDNVLENQNSVVDNNSNVEDTTIVDGTIIEDGNNNVDDSISGSSNKNDGGIDTNNKPENDSISSDMNSNTNSDVNSDSSNTESDNTSSNDAENEKNEEKNNTSEENDSSDEDTDSNDDSDSSDKEDSNEGNTDSEEDNTSNNDEGSENDESSEGDSGQNENDSSDSNQDESGNDEEDLTDTPKTGGSGGGGGLGDINFTPRQLDEAVSYFGLGVAGYAGSNTFSAAKECAGDAFKAIQEAAGLVSDLNPDGNRLITTTGSDMKSIVSNVKAVTGANGSWGYLDSLQNKAKKLYKSYRKLNSDYEFYVYSDYIKEIEDAHRAGEKSPLETSFENRGMDFESFAASIANGYTNYFEDEIERITEDGAKGKSWKDSLLYRIGKNNKIDDYNTYEEVLAGLQGMRDAACITMYTLGTANINGTVLLNMDSHKTEDGVSYRDYIEQNVLDGLDKPDYMGEGKPSDEEADDYKSDSQKQLEMVVLDGYTKIPENERQDNHNVIITSVQNHIQDVIDFYSTQKGSEENPEGLVPANHSVYTLAQIGVSNEAFKDGIYLSEDPREYPDGTIVPARSSSGNTFVDLFNQMTSSSTEGRTDRSVFEEQFFLAQACYDGTERDMYYYQEMLYGCNEETGEFREGLGNDYILDVINSKDCSAAELRKMFGDDYEQYVTKDENGKYVFTDKVDDTVINNAFFAMDGAEELYAEHSQYFEKDANGNITFAKGITIDYLAFEHFRDKADQSVVANSEIMYQMQVLSYLGGYFPANSREYEAQYNSAYSSYKEAHAKWEEEMKKFKDGKLDEAPVEPKFEEMYPGLQSPEDRFTDQATQESARGIYLALANGDVGIEEFLPDANPYPGVEDIWTGGSMSNIDLMDPAVAQKYGITQGLDLVFSEPAVNYTADELEKYGVTGDSDKTTYQSFCDNVLMGMENTNMMLVQNAERYDNVQALQIQLRQEEISDAWWDIIEILGEVIGLSSDTQKTAGGTDPVGLAVNQASNYIDYFTGEKENPIERISEAWDKITTAKSIISICNTSKNENNNTLIELNNKWKWIIPQYSDFTVNALNISDNYDINDYGLTNASRESLEQEIINRMSEEEKAQFTNNRSLEAYVNEIADAREALILLDYMSQNEYNRLTLTLGSNDRVRSYLKNFSYLGKHNGKFDKINSVACLQYIYNTRGTNTFTTLFNSTNSAGFNLEAQYRANLYLENMSAKAYETVSNYIDASPEMEQILENAFNLAGVYENFLETFSLPALNGAVGFVNNIAYAVINPLEDLASLIFDKDLKIHNHIPSMNDAIWGYIMSGVDTGQLTQTEVYCMQAFTSIGNMAIPMIASAVVSAYASPEVGKWVGAGLMGLGAFGGSLENGKREGLSNGYAYAYAGLSAVSELLMERFVGGIFGEVGGTGFKAFFNSILSEMMEESIQELIDPLLSDIAAMIDPQYMQGINGFTEGSYDVGLRELFTDPEGYIKRLVTGDFNPQAVFDSAVTAAISAFFMGAGKLRTATESLLKYNNSNIIDLVSILQQDLVKNGYSNTQASIIMSQKLSILLESKIDINKAVQDAMKNQEMKQSYEQWKKDNEAAEANKSFTEKLKGEEDARGGYDYYNYVLEQVFNEITNGNTDGSIPSLLEFDIENLLSKVTQLETEIDKLSENIEVNAEKINDLKSQINEILENTIPEARSKMEQLQNEANEIIEKNKVEISELQKELEKLGEEFNNLTETDNNQELIDKVREIVAKIQELETQNTILNIRNQSVSLNDLQNRIQTIKSQLEKKISKKQRETLQKELDIAQKNYADALVSEKNTLLKDVVNLQEGLKHDDVNGNVNDGTNVNNKTGIKTLLGSYIIEISKIESKLEQLRNDGIKFEDNTDTSVIKNIESDIDSKKKVLTYLNSSIVGVGVIGMGVSTAGTGTISNVIKYIDNKINSLNKEKTDLQKLGNKENKGNKNDSEISKRKHDVKQELKQNREIKSQLLTEMANHGLTENSPITDLMNSVQNDINSYYDINSFSDSEVLAAKNFDVSRRIQLAGVNADVSQNLDSIISNIKELQNIDIENSSNFKVQAQQILDSLLNLKSKLPGLDGIKTKFSEVGNLIKSVDLKNTYDSIVATFTKIINDSHIDMSGINKLKEQLISFKESVVKFYNEGLFKDAIAMSENAAEIMDAEFEIIDDINSRDIFESLNIVNSKVVDLFSSLSKLVTDNQLINNLVQSVKNLVQKVQIDPGAINVVNSEISSLRDVINKLKEEIALKDSHSLSMEEAQILDAEFDILQEITAKDIYDSFINENKVIIESLNKIKDLFKGNNTILDMVNSISTKFNEIRSKVKIESSVITSLREEIIKLKAELALKDAHSLSMEEGQILDAEFEVLDNISASDIYSIALNEYGVNKAIDIINKSVQSINNIIKNIQNISLSKTLHQMIDTVSSKLNSLTQLSQLHTKLNEAIEQLRSAIQTKNEANIQKAKESLEKIKNEIVDFVKRNYNKDALIFESVDTDSSVSQFDSSIVKSIDKLFSDINGVLDKAKLDSTSKFKMFAEVHSLKGRINQVIDNINSLSEVELQQLVNELGSKKGEFIDAVSKLYILDESIIHEQQNIQEDVALEIDSSIRTSEDLIREAINNNDANAIVEIAKSDFGIIESMLKNGDISFLTIAGIPQSLIVQVVNYVNANNIKIDFGYNAGLAATFINNGLTAGFNIESLNLLSSELLMTLNGSTILNPQQESMLRYIFTYVNNQLTTNIGDMTFLNEIISSISRISMDGSNIKIVDSLISLMPQNLQILTFKQTVAQSSYSNSPAFIKLMYETGSKTMEYIKSVYYTSDGQINSAKILPVLQLFTNQAFPANLTHEAINSVLDPIAGSMGQEMRRFYFQFGGSEVLSLNQSFMGIPIRAFVDDVSNMDVIKFKINQFKDAVSKGNIPLAIRQCVKIASFHDMVNPQDYMWAMRYNGKNLPAGFTSGATGGSGNYNFWNGTVGDSDLRIISHEFGHCLDSELAVMFTKGLSHFSDTPAWVKARSMDAQISIDRQSVTDYSANANCEDFADAVREFIMNRTYFESKFPNRAKVLNECLTNFAVNKLNLDSIKDVNSMATLMVNCGVDSNALSQILKQNPSLQSLKDALVRQFAFSEDAITILKLNDIKDVNSMAMFVTQNGFNRLYANQLLRITTDLQTLKDTFVRDISLNEGYVLSALQIKSATTLSDLSQVLSLYSLDVNKVFGITSNPTIIKDALYRFVYFGEDIIANLYLSNITNPDAMASLMKEVGFNAEYVDNVRSVSEGIRRFRNDFHRYYHPSNLGSVISILAKYSNSGGNVAVSNNQGLFGKNFFSKPSEQINPSVSSVNVKAINEARNAYIKGDIQRVFEIGSRNFEVIQDLLNNNKVDILAYEGISTQMLMDSIKYLNSINNLDSISNMTFEFNSKRAVREMLDMGVYNFTVTKNNSETALASCIEHIKKSSSIEGAKLLHAFNANGNTLLADILNSDSIKNVKKLQILANCGNKVLTQLNNQINLETKVKLFETLRGYSVDELLNVDFNNDVQYRRAEIFYNRILSEYSTQMIQKMRIDKALPFKSNSVINMLRMNSSSYANMTENEIMKEICEEKSAGQYKLIELGYGMAIKPLDYKGMDIRFFTNNRDVFSNLYAKFEVFKSYFNTLPKTFIETLNEVNFLDMDDPDNDLYSITENNNINKRFTAAAAGGWGKFYLWRTSLDFLTMTHEIGHSFDTEYYQVVHNKEGFFSEKVTAWKNAKMKDGNSTVTNYGDTSLVEDFAESMAYFMKNQTEFTQKYPNRATEIKRMLRELTFVKYGLNNITDMKTLVIHMMNNGISQGQIKSILSQKVTFNAVKNAYMDYMSFGTDIQISLMTPNNTTFKIRPITMKNSTNAKVNNRTNNKAWFGNRSISNRSSNPLVNQINRAIASGQSVVNIEINNAADMSVQALREISDLTKVQFFVKGIFSDVNGNLKAKYNNPRYIARHTYTGAELIAINAKLDQLQSRIDMRLPVSQRARQIYELIASEYNYLRPANGTHDRFNDSEYLVSQSLRGVTSNNIIGREGLICAGFASVFKELCTRCGVTADYIRGDVVVDRLTNRTGRHAWNVFIDENGNAVPVDACWRSGGGRDYFGRSDMFAQGRSADADEAFRDYGAIRQQQVQRVQEVQRVQQGFNDPKSMLDFAVKQMDAKYGPGAGINALRRYLKTGELTSMTSANGARNVLSKVSMRDVNVYVQNNSSVDLSIYSSQVRNIFETMARRHGSYDDAMNQLIEYAQTGNPVYITSMNNARGAIQEIPIQAVKQFINDRLSYQYFNEHASAPYVSEMAPAPSVAVSDQKVSIVEILDLNSELLGALRKANETGKVILKYNGKTILLNGGRNGKSYSGSFKHVHEVAVEHLVNVDDVLEVFNRESVIRGLRKQIIINNNVLTKIDFILDRLVDTYTNFDSSEVFSRQVNKEINKLSYLDKELPKDIADKINTYLISKVAELKSKSLYMDVETVLKLMECSGLNDELEYKQFYDFVKKQNADNVARFNINEIKCSDGSVLVAEDVISIIKEAKLRMHSVAIRNYLESDYYNMAGDVDSSGNSIYAIGHKTLVNASISDKKSIYEILARGYKDTDAITEDTIDLVIYHIQATKDYTELEGEKLLLKLAEDQAKRDFSKINLDLSTENIEDLFNQIVEFYSDVTNPIYKEYLINNCKKAVIEYKDKVFANSIYYYVKINAIKKYYELGNMSPDDILKIGKFDEYSGVINKDFITSILNSKHAKKVKEILAKKDNIDQSKLIKDILSCHTEMKTKYNQQLLFDNLYNVVEVSNYDEYSLNSLLLDTSLRDSLFKIDNEYLTFTEFAIKVAFNKGNLLNDKDTRDLIFEKDLVLRKSAEEKDLSLKEYGSQKSVEVESTYQIKADEIARRMFEFAREKEVEITEDVKKLQVNNSYLIGLENRLKTEESLSRKILSKVKKANNIDDSIFDKVSSNIGDSIRYTLVLEDSNYVEGVKSSIEKLKDMGYEMVDFKNDWNRQRNVKYQGINAAFKNDEGIVFEIQFHTELSFITKETLTHEYYEIARNKDNIPESERILADKIQCLFQKNVIIPEGVESIQYSMDV